MGSKEQIGGVQAHGPISRGAARDNDRKMVNAIRDVIALIV